MLKDLNKAINKYFKNIIKSFDFVLYEDYSGGMGAYKKYKNNFLKIYILDDRGDIGLYISAIYGKEDFWDTELINSLITLENTSSEVISKGDREKILNNNLNLKEQANLIKDNWPLLVKLYDENNFRFTIKDLKKLGLERSRLIFR